jgi:exopolysaccharide biosynthesis WecB/TagA/CpsF family protein
MPKHSLPVASKWPKKYNLFGLMVSAVEYDEAVDCLIYAAIHRIQSIVSCHAVHAVVTISSNPQLCNAANAFAMITPDGQPVRWALNCLYKLKLRDRVYGPELMWRVLKQAENLSIPIYLYGGSQECLTNLLANVRESFPGILIAGSMSPPFRELSTPELTDIADEINDSGARIVFIGLGCPKQDQFAALQAQRIKAVQLCVGAAFDFHAGLKPMAPPWMQRTGLEWLFRLGCEPRRLFRRYLVTNTAFIYRFVSALCSRA